MLCLTSPTQNRLGVAALPGSDCRHSWLTRFRIDSSRRGNVSFSWYAQTKSSARLGRTPNMIQWNDNESAGSYFAEITKFTTAAWFSLTLTCFSQVLGSEKMGRSTLFWLKTSMAASRPLTCQPSCQAAIS